MSPAERPPDRRDAVRLLCVDSTTGGYFDGTVADLPSCLDPGDLLVVNDAATLPASLHGLARGAPVEVRLTGIGEGARWRAVLFGAGDWRTPTERRPQPPFLRAGDVIELGELSASVERVSETSARLVDLRFDRDGDALWTALYARGRPVQYGYLDEPLELWSVQTAYATRPWAAELPSAGRPLTWEILEALRRRGIDVATVTHAAGLSATGDPALDAALPLPERYEVPAAAVAAVAAARRRGGRVLAVGTTVVRALEAAAAGGTLRAGSGITDLRIGPDHALRVVDGLLTGMHAPAESHYALLGAFVDGATLARATEHARVQRYRCHEFGDVTLLAPGLDRARIGSPRAAPPPRAGSEAPARRSRPRATARSAPPADP
jgi:S-adenosylmethionine:tRNA ribosyltransferase-isomerase